MILRKPLLILVSLGAGLTVMIAAATVYALTGPLRVVPDDPPPRPPSESGCRPTDPQPGHSAPAGQVSVTLDKPGSGALSGSASAGISIDSPVVEEDGRDSQTATVTLHDLKLTAEGEKMFAQVKAEASVGERVTLATTMPARTMGGVDWSVPPNPIDPGTIPVGATVTLDRTVYAELGLTATFRKIIRASFEGSLESSISVAVTRLVDNKVRVLAGPTTTLTRMIKLGLGTDDFNVALVNGTTVKQTHLEQTEFDLGTAGGKLAYYATVFAGVAVDRDAVQAKIIGTEYAKQVGFVIKLKSLQIGNTRTYYSENHLLTVYRDGRQTEELSMRENDNTMVRKATFPAGSDDPDNVTFQLRLRGAEPEDLMAFNEHYGNVYDVKIKDKQNVVINFDRDDIAVIHRQALEIMAHLIRTQYGHEDLPEDTTADELERWIDRKKNEGDDNALAWLLNVKMANGETPYFVYLARDGGAILFEIWQGVQVGASPANSLQWLVDWAETAYQATGYDAHGPGKTICRATTPDTVAEEPEFPSGTTCRSIGDGLIAIVARGEARCATAESVLKKFRSTGRPLGQTIKINGWSCAILDGLAAGSKYTVFTECSSGKNLIKAWPDDSPFPKGWQVAPKDHADFDPDTGYVYGFATSTGLYECKIRMPDPDQAGQVYCRGNLPKAAQATEVWLDRGKPARYENYEDPHRPYPPPKLKPGQVLAVYGVACTTGKDDAVTCINGKHRFTLRRGSAQLS